jgi:hypothetical protein
MRDEQSQRRKEENSSKSTTNLKRFEGQLRNRPNSLGSRDLLSISNAPQPRRAQGFDDVESLRRVDVFRVGSARAGCRCWVRGGSRERCKVDKPWESELVIWGLH